MTLHPMNDEIGTAGLRSGPPPARHPVKYVDDAADVKHRSPLCPDLDAPFRALGAEEAVYVVGESVCETCRSHDVRLDETGWTDPRYRRCADGPDAADSGDEAVRGDQADSSGQSDATDGR